MTFVTAFRARRGRERLRRDREARRAGGSRLGGSRAAHDVATHTSDQISARIPHRARDPSTRRRGLRRGQALRRGVASSHPLTAFVLVALAARRPPDARDPALEDPGCRPASPEALDSQACAHTLDQSHVLHALCDHGDLAPRARVTKRRRRTSGPATNWFLAGERLCGDQRLAGGWPRRGRSRWDPGAAAPRLASTWRGGDYLERYDAGGARYP